MKPSCDSAIEITEEKEGKTLDFALPATRNNRGRFARRAIRAIASAALALTLAAAFDLGFASAQIPEAESEAGERRAEAVEETKKDQAKATPAPAKPSKTISKPFEPSERIEAESVISFPTNI